MEKEQLQKQNLKLEESMKTIRLNFKTLLETAKNEIARKDTQIHELRKEKDNMAFRRLPRHHEPRSNQERAISKPPSDTADQDREPPAQRDSDRPVRADVPLSRDSGVPERKRSKEPDTRKERSKSRERSSNTTARDPKIKDNPTSTDKDRTGSEKNRSTDPPRNERSGKITDRRDTTSSGHRDSKRSSRDRDRSKERSSRDRPSRSSRDRSRDKDKGRGTRDRSRDRARSSKDRHRSTERGSREDTDSRDHSRKRRNESPRRRRSSSKSGSTSSRGEQPQPVKKQRLDTVPEVPAVLVTEGSGSPPIPVAVVKAEVEEGERLDQSAAEHRGKETEAAIKSNLFHRKPNLERPPEPMLTSFAGSLERLKKEGMLINTERTSVHVDSTNTLANNRSSVSPSSPIACLPSPALNEPDPDHGEQASEEIAENSLQISAEIRSSPTSCATTMASPKTSPVQLLAASTINNAALTSTDIEPTPIPSSVTQSKDTPLPPSVPSATQSNLHPHMNPMPAQDHLPMMVIPREAVIAKVVVVSENPPLPEHLEKPAPPPPPPKPKIQTVAGNRDPYAKEESAAAAAQESNLTVANLDRINKAQEEHQLEYLRAEIARVAGPDVANDPQLIKSFKQKEKEAERRRLAAAEMDNPEVVVGAPPSLPSSHKNADLEAINQTGGEATLKATTATDKLQKENTTATAAENLPNPVAPEKCIIMGHSKYNYTQNSEGKRIMVVSRLKKTKRVPTTSAARTTTTTNAQSDTNPV